MSDLLSEDELNALSEGVADGSIPVDTGFNTKTKVRKHDLASEDSTLGVNLGSVEMINERFIRLFRLGLVEVLRSTPKIIPGKPQPVGPKTGSNKPTIRQQIMQFLFFCFW